MLQHLRAVCLEEQLPCPRDRPCLGMARGKDLALFRKSVIGKPPHPATAPHSHRCPCQVPTTHLGDLPAQAVPGARAGAE